MYEALKRINGETEEEYIWRVGQLVDGGTYQNWKEIAPFINKEWREDETQYRDESAYRKKYQYAKQMYENVFSKQNGNQYYEDLQAQKRELERAKIQFRDERNAWQRQNYIQARAESQLDLIEEKLCSQGRVNFEGIYSLTVSSDNDLIVMLSDLHIGQCFDSAFGKYNSDIARERLNQYMAEILKIQDTHNSENCVVVLLGDLISGFIHKTIQVSNRENMIEQVKVASELISSFCYELTKHFNKVSLYSAAGNHSRLTGKKDEAMHDDRLDSLVTWSVGCSLQHIDNFMLCDTNIDSGITVCDVRGKRYIGVHGDYDDTTDAGISRLCMMLGEMPYAILSGHKHTQAYREFNGVRLIQSGSLAGSGDDYTIEHRLFSKPSQTVLVCDDNGVRAVYPVTL